MDLTRDTIKLRADFVTRRKLVDYLVEQCEIGLPRSLITSRIARGWHPFPAITRPRVIRPADNHPFKRHFQEKASD